MLASSTPAGSRRPRAGADWVEALDSVARGIRDPVAKLRFIRVSLARYQRLDRWLRMVPYAPLRKAIYRWLHLEGLQSLLGPHPLGAPISLDRSSRRVVLVGRASLLLAATFAFAALGLGIYRFRPAPASAATAAVSPGVSPVSLPPTSPVPAPPADAVPRAGVAPDGIWLVEQGSDWEQYSSGLRIETSFTIRGEPRRYRVFNRRLGIEKSWRQEPVGLVFHTSESDIWPLEPEFNQNLRKSSHGLLQYVRRNKLYNYLIDRFGRVYRVVDEQSKANHAGYSVWANGDEVYLNLNNAFLGVAFETRWEGQALPITEAQFAAGRSLADYLRQRFRIAPEMCVAHGLASVNPRKHLIGHHLDWARGFPFEAFGLPNQYRRTAPAVALFGFGYDDDFTKVMGEPWEGVREAEKLLAREAEGRGMALDEIRKDRQDLYDRWIQELSREDASR